MQARDVLDLIILGALWGGAFPLQKVAVATFGPFALVAVRVTVAAIVLLLMLRDLRPLRAHAGKLLVLGLLNTAIPFSLFSFATLHITAGLASLLNATTPMFGAAIARAWLGERLSWTRVLGIGVGFLGIASIVWDKVGVHAGGATLGVLAGLLAAALYGAAACFTKRYLSDINPRANAAGSVVGATLFMLPLGAWQWPPAGISALAWGCAIALGLLCTALAYVIYFRLMPRIGAARAVTVTFLIPVFGIFWGAIFLGEPITWPLLTGCGVVLLGTGLATGVIAPRPVPLHTPSR